MDHSPPNSGPASQEPSRRRFMKGGAALGAALMAGAARPIPGDAQSSGQPAPAPDDPSKVVGGPIVACGKASRFEDAVREKGPPSMPDEWGANFTPLADLRGIITPSGLHYEVCRGGIPDIDPRTHRLLIHGMVGEPWPTFNDGWKFYVYVKDSTVEQVLASIKDMIGEDGMHDIEVSSPKTYPVNCIVPELLRDIFGFPVQNGGHIDALAFCVEEIGRQRYNNAQAVLRRACDRLRARGLIRLRGGQSFFDPSFYVRTGIRLTEDGVVVADALLRADNQKASADLGISLEAAALL